MRFPPHGPGFGFFGGILEEIVAGLVFLICLAVVVGLIFVLVRFLLVATKAAEIYVAKNSDATPVQPSTTTPSTPVATTPVATAPTTTAATKPVPRTRTTKPPTT